MKQMKRTWWLTPAMLTTVAVLVAGCASGANLAGENEAGQQRGVEKICQQYNESVGVPAYHQCVQRYMGGAQQQSR